MMIFPKNNSNESDKLCFEHRQYLEGALMKPVQARVLERGRIRARQAANL
jgi:hypothetical protein